MASDTLGVTLTVKDVHPDDTEEFQTFLRLTEAQYNESWPEQVAEEGWLKHYSAQICERVKTDAKRWLWLVQHEGKTIGLANFYLSGPEDARIGTIQELYVMPAYRNRHFGATLFGMVRAELGKAGVKRIKASVPVDEPGNWKFFENYGFRLERVHLVLNTDHADEL